MSESATEFSAAQIAGSDRFRYGVICDAIAVHERENTPLDDHTFTRLREMRDAIETGHTVTSRRTDDDGVPAERLPKNTDAVSRRGAPRASELQLTRISRELQARNLANATDYINKMIGQASDGTISKRDASELIDWLNGQPKKVGKVARPASAKQIDWIRKEYARRDLNDTWTTIVGELVKILDAGNQIDSKAASAALDHLFNAPFKPKDATKQTASDRVTEDGMYQLADGTIYKVQFAKVGSGNLYAKRLVVDTDGDDTVASFAYERGALSKITPADKMSLEAAKAFGQLYGICCRCASPLTDENSIADGIGPICASRM